MELKCLFFSGMFEDIQDNRYIESLTNYPFVSLKTGYLLQNIKMIEIRIIGNTHKQKFKNTGKYKFYTAILYFILYHRLKVFRYKKNIHKLRNIKISLISEQNGSWYRDLKISPRCKCHISWTAVTEIVEIRKRFVTFNVISSCNGKFIIKLTCIGI